ncbi:MAG: hypothetical protein K0Q50_415, partial [Vampirovibrio sp.]|nr:hypothetical protein [Vampirovibrio sp.]
VEVPILSMIISNKVQFTRDALTWVAPAIGIPTLRYFQDDKAQRKELFVRDASTYTLGALLFLGTYFAGKRMMHHFPRLGDGSRELIPFTVALAVNILYAGIGSVRLSKWFRPAGQAEPASKPQTQLAGFNAWQAQPSLRSTLPVYSQGVIKTEAQWVSAMPQNRLLTNG